MCCCPYGRVETRKGRPFTLARWNQHVKENEEHKQAVAELNESNRITAMIKSKDTKLTKKDRENYARMSKKPTQITSFFASKPNEVPSLAQLDQPVATSMQSSSVDNSSASMAPSDSIAVTLSESDAVPSPTHQKVCQGVFEHFRPKDNNKFGEYLLLYSCNHAVDSESGYKFGYVDGKLPQVFAANCTGAGAKFRKGSKRTPDHWNCDHCEQTHQELFNKKRLKQTIRDGGAVIENAIYATKRTELTPTDLAAMSAFSCTTKKHFSRLWLGWL
jgi:hypothetical protein